MNSYFKLLGYLKKYRKLLVLCIVANVLMAVFTVVNIPMVKPFFDLLIYGQYENVQKPAESLEFGNISEHMEFFFANLIDKYDASRALILVCVALVIVIFLKNLFRYLGHFFLAPIRNGMVRDIRVKMYDKLIHMPLGYYSEERKGDLISRITNDVQLVENSMIAMLIFTFREPLILVGSLLYMLFVSPQLCLFVLVLIVFITVIIGRISKTLKKKSLQAQNSLGELVAVTDETIAGSRIIKAFTAESYVSGKFNELNEEYRGLMNRILWRRDLSSPLTEVLAVTLVATLLWYGTRLVHTTSLDPSTFITFIMAFYFVIEPAKNFSSAYYNIQKGMGGLNRIEDLLAQKQEILNDVSARSIKVFNDCIRFENVSFNYGKNSELVLDDVSFEIPKGSCVALVGSSGAGKSTIADLIPRFYEVSHGQISIDSVNINDYRLNDLRGLMSIVSQDPVLFNDSIVNNITMGQQATEAEIIAATKAANAHQFILDSEHGYQTHIGDRGVKLSGGQRQRISIARALLSNPPLLILDEATSALDSESEKLVQQALDEVMKNRTTLVIAHRLSTIHNATNIVILEKGKIIESGTHDELITKRGRYSEFVNLQALA